MNFKNTDFEDEQYRFKRFMQIEGFTETTSKSGSFRLGTPIFYKRISIDTFLVFNIPYMGVQKSFYADLWLFNTSSQKNSVLKEADETNMLDIRLGLSLKDTKSYNEFVYSSKLISP